MSDVALLTDEQRQWIRDFLERMRGGPPMCCGLDGWEHWRIDALGLSGVGPGTSMDRKPALWTAITLTCQQCHEVRIFASDIMRRPNL